MTAAPAVNTAHPDLPMPRKLLKLMALLGLVTFLALVLVQQLATPAQAQARSQTQEAALEPAALATASTAAVPLPRVQLEYTAAGGARLSGRVPTEGERQALLHRARAIYGADRVQDDLQVLPVANPPWLSPAFLPDLRAAHQALAHLADGTLTVQAVLPDEPARMRLAQAVTAFGAEGLRVDSSRLLVHAAADRRL